MTNTYPLSTKTSLQRVKAIKRKSKHNLSASKRRDKGRARTYEAIAQAQATHLESTYERL